MDRLFKTILSIHEFKVRIDDDYVDRLSRQYTIVLLCTFAFILSTKQFVGNPISCWCPAQFTASHRDYTNTICWVSNTYYLPMEDAVPSDHFILKNHHPNISYYQWVPLIMMWLSLLCFAPCLIWRFINRRAGINVSAIMEAATVCQHASYLEIREKTVRYIVSQLDRYFLAQRDHRTGCCVRLKHTFARLCCLVGGRMYGNYLTTTYIAVKFLYVVNIVGQLFLLDLFLGQGYHMWGILIVNRLIRGEDWTSSERFPRVTICDFEIRHMARVHSYVVQCVLTINLFNEKIFIFIWFWYTFVCLMTIFSFIKWIFRAVYWPGQIHYVKKHLKAFNTMQRESGIVTKFTENYLRRDGLFLLRLIANNVGEVVAAETIVELWNNYNPERRMIVEKPGRKHVQKADRTTQNGGQPSRMDVV